MIACLLLHMFRHLGDLLTIKILKGRIKNLYCQNRDILGFCENYLKLLHALYNCVANIRFKEAVLNSQQTRLRINLEAGGLFWKFRLDDVSSGFLIGWLSIRSQSRTFRNNFDYWRISAWYQPWVWNLKSPWHGRTHCHSYEGNIV